MTHKRKKRFTLVVVEGGCVSAITCGPDETWDVWDWDNFADDPAQYWMDRGAEQQEHIRTEWPELYADIQERLADQIADEKEEREKDPFWMVPREGSDVR